LALPGAYLARWPGRYTAVITRSGGGDDNGDGGRNASSSTASSPQSSSPAASAVAFSLEVATPPSGVRLAPADAAAVADLMARCCPPPAADPAAPDYDAGAGALCRLALPAALSSNHPADTDLCALPPITCDDEGKLRQLTLAGAGLDCGGKGLPPSFANLTSLRLLDVAFNDVGGTVADLAAIASALPQLRALFARYAGVTGRLEDACPLVAGGALEVLSLSGNSDIAGAVPSCLLAAPQLEELYISGLAVSGPLPNVLPQSSRLRALYAIGSLQGPSADDANNTSSSSSSSDGALTGTIPASIVNAKNLMRLDLSGQQLEGEVPPLPDSLVYLNVSGNGGLTSLPLSLPPRLAVLDLHGNALKGAPPSITLSLVSYDISDNLFEGGMPDFVGDSIQMGGGSGSSTTSSGSGRRSLLKSAAQRRGLKQAPEPPSLLVPSLRAAYLARNALAGPLSDAWAAAPAYLRVFDSSSNKLAGPLPRDWRLRRLEVLDLSNNTITGVCLYACTLC
jgi:Leucine-rich repeat (LRR) protein